MQGIAEHHLKRMHSKAQTGMYKYYTVKNPNMTSDLNKRNRNIYIRNILSAPWSCVGMLYKDQTHKKKKNVVKLA